MNINVLTLQGMSTDKVINPLGSVGVVAQHDKLQQDVRTLLLTRKGSLIGNPAYGSNLYTYLFDQASSNTLNSINLEIEEILKANYNFINKVETESRVEDHTLYISISYTTMNDNLSTKLEYKIPLNEEGYIDYE
jgi:phage baseplate assembly protein W